MNHVLRTIVINSAINMAGVMNSHSQKH